MVIFVSQEKLTATHRDMELWIGDYYQQEVDRCVCVCMCGGEVGVTVGRYVDGLSLWFICSPLVYQVSELRLHTKPKLIISPSI